MKRTPKTPIEFDYDLWTTEDGKCMVRVKRTGEQCEVSRETFRVLRTEEKSFRRELSEPTQVFSYDSMPEGTGEESADIVDPTDELELIINRITIEQIKLRLTPKQKKIFDEVIVKGKSAREFASENDVHFTSVYETVAWIRKKFRKFFQDTPTKCKKMSVVK